MSTYGGKRGIGAAQDVMSQGMGQLGGGGYSPEPTAAEDPAAEAAETSDSASMEARIAALEAAVQSLKPDFEPGV